MQKTYQQGNRVIHAETLPDFASIYAETLPLLR